MLIGVQQMVIVYLTAFRSTPNTGLGHFESDPDQFWFALKYSVLPPTYQSVFLSLFTYDIRGWGQKLVLIVQRAVSFLSKLSFSLLKVHFSGMWLYLPMEWSRQKTTTKIVIKSTSSQHILILRPLVYEKPRQKHFYLFFPIIDLSHLVIIILLFYCIVNQGFH